MFDDLNTTIFAAAFVGAVVGSILTMVLQRPRVVYVPYDRPAPAERVERGRGPSRRVHMERERLPKDHAKRWKATSYADAYHAEYRQLIGKPPGPAKSSAEAYENEERAG